MSKNLFSHHLLSFEGRINRETFWIRGVVICVLIIILQIIPTIMTPFPGKFGAVVDTLLFALAAGAGIFAYLVVVWAGMAVCIRRCHDLDMEGWYTFVLGWNVIALPFFRGTPAENRFGEPPKPPPPETKSSHTKHGAGSPFAPFDDE